MKWLKYLAVSWNGWVNQSFHETAKNISHFMKRLISQIGCNIYTWYNPGRPGMSVKSHLRHEVPLLCPANRKKPLKCPAFYCNYFLIIWWTAYDAGISPHLTVTHSKLTHIQPLCRVRNCNLLSTLFSLFIGYWTILSIVITSGVAHRCTHQTI